jgi:hypothetical protein
MRRFKWAITICSILLIGNIAIGYAEDKPNIEPRVDKLLKDMSEYLEDAKEFTFHAEISFDQVLTSGQKLQFGASQDIGVRRPDRARTRYIGDLRNNQVWYNGKTITILDVDRNLYSVIKAPSKIDKALDHIIDMYDIAVPTADLIYSNPYKILIEKVESGFYVGMDMVDGIMCHHLAFSQENVDWQIWIEERKHLVPRKFIIDYKNIPGSPQYVVFLSEWDFNVKLADRLFEFEAPEGAEKIEFLPIEETYAKDTGKE